MLVGAYFLLRSLSSLGRASMRFPDTLGYFDVNYLGQESRLWPVPLLYAIVTGDTARVALHIMLGTAAWAFVSHVVARTSRFPLTVTGIILLFGLSPQIVRFDLAILSESIGISLMVILVAASLQVLSQRSTLTLTTWVISLIAFSMTRPSQLIALFLITGATCLVVIRSRKSRHIFFAGVLICISTWGVLQLRNNRSMSELNFYTVLQERVIENDQRFEWFTSEGMPLDDTQRPQATYENPSNLPGELLDYLKLPIGQLAPALMRVGDIPLAEWVRESGWTTYARYVVAHPADTWSRLQRLSSPTLNPQDRDLLPLDSRTIFPRHIFLPWQLWVAIGSIGAIVHMRYGMRAYSQLFGATMFMGAPWYAITVLTSGIEHPRHVITTAVAIRLVSLLTVIGLFASRRVPTPTDELVIR